MTLGDWANISVIVQAFLIVISLGLIWYQLRESSKLAKAANVQSLTEQAAAFNALLYENEELSKLWYSYGRGLDTNIKKQRYKEMMVQWLIFHQNIYYQRKNRLLDTEIYQPWLEDLKFTVKYHNLGLVATNLLELFPGPFGQHLAKIENLMANGDPLFKKVLITNEEPLIEQKDNALR
jgi:hypothetical protein